MDLASVCAAFGLSAASGLNAWLPLFAGALLNRLDVVDLAAPFDDLSGTGWIVALGVLTRPTSSATRSRRSTTSCTRSDR